MAAQSPRLTVSPQNLLVDDTWDVTVRGLRPRQEVTLLCRVPDEVRWFAHAHFKSDDQGVVDVSRSPSLGGSYTGIEPMGLITRLVQEPGFKPGRRLAKSDVTTPFETLLYLFEGFLSADQCLPVDKRKDQILSQDVCYRSFMAEGVERISVEQGRMKGTLFIPKGPGPFPGVIDLFGTVGGITEHRSALLASRGVAAFTVSYFTPGKGEGMISDIEYFEGAVDYLLAHPKVLKPYAGIVGVSQGAELALIISSLVPKKVKSCVSINGPDIFTLVDHSYQGEVFPMCELDFELLGNKSKAEEGYSFADGYNQAEPERWIYQVPVERAECDFLLLHSGDDRSVPVSASEHVVKRLRRFGRTNYRLIVYPGAGHLLEPPHSPHFRSSYHALFSGIAVWGGEPRQHARAQETAWRDTLDFFKTNLVSHCLKAPGARINSQL